MAASDTPTRGSRRARGRAAEGLFFPAATLYGALVVPLSVHGMVSGRPLLPAFAGIPGHAHELLFGYALAVVTGFLVGRATAAQLTGLALLWALARVTFLTAPASALALTANAAFALYLAAIVVPPFLRSAKKWRNRATGPLLIALSVAVVVFQLGLVTTQTWLQFLVLEETVLVFALLMLFMGGRIIAPAAAGAIQRSGGHLEARVQPRLEAGLLVCLPLAMVALLLPHGRTLAAILVMIVAAIALVRLLRWRLWDARGRADLWCLGLGYAWLVAGLAVLGASWLGQLVPAGTATHAITVGALGTLTTGVMARVRLTRNKREPGEAWTLPAVGALISAAALARLLGGAGTWGLGLAALLWSAGLVLLLALLLRVPAR